MKPNKILKVGNGTALVKTRGLRRLVIQPSGEIFRESCDREFVEAAMEAWHDQHGKGHRVAKG